jgi:hypothetical protein
MKRILTTILALGLSSGCLAETTDPLCVLDPAEMPASWRPPAALRKSLNPAPWSEAEARDVEYAKNKGVDEMIAYFKRAPSAIETPWGDSIEALIQSTYASANSPEFDAKVRKASRDNLTTLVDLFFKEKPNLEQVTCNDFVRLLPLALFAHEFYAADDPRTPRITDRTNAAYRDCGSLKVATDLDIHKILSVKQARPIDLMEVYIWVLWFIEAELYPDIELPAEAREYGPMFWNYFKTYRLKNAKEFEEGPWDDGFVAMADIAHHIAHLPTGTHRFPLYVEDHPALYRFHRENLYAAMQLGELDLFASLVDTLRQYGCTPENDVQVRDGTRFLLKIFHANGDSWIKYRQEGETDADLSDYDKIHYPWTSVLGIRDRQPEQPKPDNIGGIVRRWVPPPR